MTSEAGWYPDPNGRHELRYWDGSAWTEHISDAGEAGSDPVGDTTQASATPFAETTQVTPTVADQALDGAESAQVPWAPIAAGIAVLVLVIGGLVFFLGGDDGGSDSASDGAQLTTDDPAVDFTESVNADRAIRFRVIPEGANANELDLAMVLAADVGDVVSMGKANFGDQANDLDDDEILDRLGFATVAETNPELAQSGIDSDLITLGYRDDNGPGEPEADFFAAPANVDLHIITFDLGLAEGEVAFESETSSGEVDPANQSSFDDVWFSDPSFYGPGFSGSYPFGIGAGLFGELFSGLPDDLLDDLPDELDGLLDDLPDELDGLFDDLPDDLQDLDPEDLFGDLFGESGDSIPGLEDFFEGLLEGENNGEN
jgi:hypothetical protein